MLLESIFYQIIVSYCLRVDITMTFIPMRLRAIPIVPPIYSLVLIENVVRLNTVSLLPISIHTPLSVPTRKVHPGDALQSLQQLVLPINRPDIQLMQVPKLELVLQELGR